MKRMMIPLALLASPAAAQTGGFTAEDLATAAREGAARVPDTVPMRRIAAQTEVLRTVLAVNMANAGRRISVDELRVLTKAIGAPSQDRDVILSWLMRSGLTTAADDELSGIYSPLADAWLVLRWQTIGGTPRLVDAGILRGTTLRADTKPDWLQGEGPFATELLRVKLQAFAAFPHILEDPGIAGFFALLSTIRNSEREAVLARGRGMIGALSQWSRDNPAALARLQSMIGRHEDPALLALPERVRDELGPIAAVSTPQGIELLLQSPIYPARTVFATFASPEAQPTLFGVNLSPAPARSAAR